jgi:type VI secretion system secreted protein VgrG
MASAPSLPAVNHRLEVKVASGDHLDVRHFHVADRMSSLFEISLVVVSENDDVDFESVVGQPASFHLRAGLLPSQERSWTGLVSHIQQVAVEDRGLSTYQMTLVPTLWLATQRRNHRMFQLKSEVDIVVQLLKEWGIEPEQRLSGTYKKRKYRVQYGETDFQFMSRMLEDVGISFYFETKDGETKMVLHDAPQSNSARPPIAFRDQPTDADLEHVTEVRVTRRVRPGKYTLRDHDYRRPANYKLLASAKGASSVEEKLERFHYTPGSFLFESDKGDATPSADDKGKYRTDETEANSIAQKRLDAKRAIAKTVHFDTNTLDPQPGTVLSFLDHPKSDLGPGKRFLLIASSISGKHDSKWLTTCEAVTAESPYRPALVTPKPKASGVESATVVGPAGEEIHTDEFGRVRVHFHWDRESKMDDNSSCWIHVSQPWGGTNFGGSNLPRIGQEVIVDFLSGDPDRPIIVGRVYTNLQKTPYKLPDNKTQSGWQSRSSPGGGLENFNEVMFEDKKGQELFRMQAEKDLHKLVKNDEQVKIGRDRTKSVGRDCKQDVGRNRDVSIGKDLTKRVAENEREMTGQNRSVVVGNNRSTQIGQICSTIVGQMVSVAISPPSEGGPPEKTTNHVIEADKYTIQTKSGASIVLEGNKITLNAERIEIKGGAKGILMEAAGNDCIIKGAPKVKLNP